MTLADLGAGKNLTPPALLIFCMGQACAGKSTFLEAAASAFSSRAGLVEVGKEFRRRYPPGFFAGHASPAHTRAEAKAIYHEFVSREITAGREVIFIDGQPRSVDQVDFVLSTYPEHPKIFFFFYAPLEVRLSRAALRHPTRGSDRVEADNYDLAKRRIEHDDDRMAVDTLLPLLEKGKSVQAICTVGDYIKPALFRVEDALP